MWLRRWTLRALKSSAQRCLETSVIRCTSSSLQSEPSHDMSELSLYASCFPQIMPINFCKSRSIIVAIFPFGKIGRDETNIYRHNSELLFIRRIIF
jgi:hypothetical protein